MASKGRLTNTIAVVPITAPNYAMINHADAQNSFPVALNRSLITNFSIRLEDQDHRVLDFQGAHFSMSLRFTFKPRHPNGHPMQETLRTLQNRMSIEDTELQQRVDDIGERTHRLHELLPIIRREIMNRRAEMLADGEVERAENVG